MSWETSNSVCDLPIGLKANMSGNAAFGILGVANGNMTTVATAQAACFTKEAAMSVCDQLYATQCSRGFGVSNGYGFTFGSTTAAYTASGPAVFGHTARFITG